LALVHIHRRDQRRRLPQLNIYVEAIAYQHKVPPVES
jgi:hypothetical protein